MSLTSQAMGGDWTSYGRTGEGTRYAPLDQINRDNVAQLEQIWVARSGDIADDSQDKEDQNTPIFAGGRLYQCSPSSQVTAIDPSTGEKLWYFNPKTTTPYWQRCRGLGFVPATPEVKGPKTAQVQGKKTTEPQTSDTGSMQASAGTNTTPSIQPKCSSLTRLKP